LSQLPIRVFFADFGVFGIDETYNQQRLNDINHTSLKLILTHCGLDVGEDGKTHQCIDYLGVASNLFGFKVIIPADPNQTDRAVRYLARENGNFLLAVGRSKTPVILDEKGEPIFAKDYKFEYGKIDLIRQGNQACIFTMGSMVPRAIKVWEILKEKGILVKIFNVSCPLALEKDLEKIKEGFATGLVITYEDHQIETGLGARIALLATEQSLTAKFLRFGVINYGASGKPDELFRLQGLAPEQVAEKILKILEK